MAFHIDNFLPYHLYLAAEATSQQFSKNYRQTFGINRTEWRALCQIGFFGPMSATDIARRSRLDKGILSRAVVKLEKNDLIKRHYRDDDRRSHNLALTARGKKTFDKLAKMAEEYDDHLSNHLTDKETKTLLTLLNKLERLGEE